MSLSNEISGEVATAILVGKDKSPQELTRLKEIVFSVQATLQQLERIDRTGRLQKVVRKSSRINVYERPEGDFQDIIARP